MHNFLNKLKKSFEKELNLKESSKVLGEINNLYKKFVADEDHSVFSVDESFLDVTASLSYFHCETAYKMARIIQRVVYNHVGIYVTVGIGDNPLLAKLALDNGAKRQRTSGYRRQNRKGFQNDSNGDCYKFMTCFPKSKYTTFRLNVLQINLFLHEEIDLVDIIDDQEQVALRTVILDRKDDETVRDKEDALPLARLILEAPLLLSRSRFEPWRKDLGAFRLHLVLVRIRLLELVITRLDGRPRRLRGERHGHLPYERLLRRHADGAPRNPGEGARENMDGPFLLCVLESLHPEGLDVGGRGTLDRNTHELKMGDDLGQGNVCRVLLGACSVPAGLKQKCHQGNKTNENFSHGTHIYL